MRLALLLTATVSISTGTAGQAATPADAVYRNARIYTGDARSRQAEALAVAGGRITYVGDESGLRPYIGPATHSEDLGGRFVMPGLIDAHMHPFEAGGALLKCNLQYLALTVPQLQERVKACLDASAAEGPQAWLQVVAERDPTCASRPEDAF